MIRIYCAKADATLLETETLTAGMVNTPSVLFTFSSDWEGLGKTAIVRAGSVIREVVLSNNQITIPAECLAKAGVNLIVGVWGGNFVTELPTVWCACGEIQDSTNPSAASNHDDPTASNVAQMLAVAERAEAAVDRIENANWEDVAVKVGNQKVNKPTSSPNGTSGQVLQTNGDGSTTWVDVGLPTDEQVNDAVTNWFEDHPEATTTVEDGAITEEKLSDALDLMVKNAYVTPQMFGALADGETDDTEAIQDALDSITDGGMVYFPSGTYIISDALKVKSNTIVFGDGDSSIIKAAPLFDTGISLKCMITTANRSLTNNSDSKVKLYRMCFDNDGVANAGAQGLISFWGVSDSVIEECIVKASGDNCWCIDLFGSNDNITVRKCTLINQAEDNKLGGCLWIRNGLNGKASSNILVDNCYLESTAKDELLCISSTYQNSKMDATVRNTKLVGKAVTNLPGFIVCAYTETNSTAKLNCFFDGLDISGKAGHYAVYVYNAAGTAKAFIANSRIDMTTGGGINGQDITTVSNSYINCTTQNSIYKTKAIGCQIHTRQAYNSKLYECYVSTPSISAVVNSDIVENCIIESSYDGIRVEASASLDVSYINNIINAGTNGINIPNTVTSLSGIILGNKIYRSANTSNVGTYGISIGKVTDKLIVSNNIVSSADTEETAKTFRYSVIVEDKGQQFYNINNNDFSAKHGAITAGTAGSKSITHKADTLYLCAAQHAGGNNVLVVLVWNSVILPLNENEYFSFSAVSNTEFTITSTQATRYSQYRLIDCSKLA